MQKRKRCCITKDTPKIQSLINLGTFTVMDLFIHSKKAVTKYMSHNHLANLNIVYTMLRVLLYLTYISKDVFGSKYSILQNNWWFRKAIHTQPTFYHKTKTFVLASIQFGNKKEEFKN